MKDQRYKKKYDSDPAFKAKALANSKMKENCEDCGLSIAKAAMWRHRMKNRFHAGVMAEKRKQEKNEEIRQARIKLGSELYKNKELSEVDLEEEEYNLLKE